MTRRIGKPGDVSQTDAYLGGYLDAQKDRDKRDAEDAGRADDARVNRVRTPNGVFKDSEHGVRITETQPDDPAFFLLKDGHTSTPVVHDTSCYICEDPEFAQMGLPLCRPCPKCTGGGDEPKGHVPADDSVCTVCGHDEQEDAE